MFLNLRDHRHSDLSEAIHADGIHKAQLMWHKRLKRNRVDKARAYDLNRLWLNHIDPKRVWV